MPDQMQRPPVVKGSSLLKVKQDRDITQGKKKKKKKRKKERKKKKSHVATERLQTTGDVYS